MTGGTGREMAMNVPRCVLMLVTTRAPLARVDRPATLLRQIVRKFCAFIALRGTTSGFERRIGLPAKKAETVSTSPW